MKFKNKEDIEKSWSEEPRKFKSMLDFLNWFDSATSIQEAINTAFEDWEKRIINFSNFKSINKHSCLEIGFGGGRLLIPARKYFENIFGLDIHNSFEKTKEFLKLQNIDDYILLNKNEIDLIKNNSIDFVYSFIVFQHFSSLEEVEFYLTHIKRVLSSSGVAHIFYGKNKENGIKIVEPEKFDKRQCSLFINPDLFLKIIKDNGFKIIEFENLLKKKLNLQLNEKNESGQARVLFSK